jgi:hypothetical protein
MMRDLSIEQQNEYARQREVERLKGEVTNLYNAQFLVRGSLVEFNEKQLNEVYKASKQLSDLCWQEIQRRRRDKQVS